jgi:hypothetical protein
LYASGGKRKHVAREKGPSSAHAAAHAFVGRTRELEELRVGLTDALAGHGPTERHPCDQERREAHQYAASTARRYLATTVKTGAFCSYTPDPRFPITWNL